MNARGCFDRRAHRCNSRAMSGDARHVAPLGPAAIAIHDDGNVLRQPRRIKMAIDLSLFPIEPRRNFQDAPSVYFVLQSSHGMRLPQQGRDGNVL